jgi:hypothetical protein
MMMMEIMMMKMMMIIPHPRSKTISCLITGEQIEPMSWVYTG